MANYNEKYIQLYSDTFPFDVNELFKLKAQVNAWNKLMKNISRHCQTQLKINAFT